MKKTWTFNFTAKCCILFSLLITTLSGQKAPDFNPADHTPSAAYGWLDIVLEASARDVERIGAMPTTLSRQMATPCTAIFNAWAAYDDKATVEFMRDSPRSTSQSGHWLRFAMAVSQRDQNDLDSDIKLFFTVSNTALDTFLATWDSKRYYDSSRPWTLVRYYFAGKTIQGWAGPGKGVIEMDGGNWHPYPPPPTSSLCTHLSHPNPTTESATIKTQVVCGSNTVNSIIATSPTAQKITA